MAFWGEAIVERFEAAGWEVIGVRRSGAGELADVTDLESVRALRERVGKVSHVVHCASSGRGGVESYQAVYVEGMRHLVEVFGDAKLMMTSSTSVYAQVDGGVVDEESEAEPERETGKCLKAAEEIALGAGGMVLRLSGIYGEGRSIILKRWLKGESKVEEDGRRVLNQIYRRDAAEAFMLLAEVGESCVYNVSEPEPKSQLETLRWLAEHSGRELPESVPIDYGRKRAWTHKVVSSEKLQQLGWKVRYRTFTDAVEDLVSTIEL